MFIIHTIKNEQYNIPLLFILLPNKIQESYFGAFKHIKKYFVDLNVPNIKCKTYSRGF